MNPDDYDDDTMERMYGKYTIRTPRGSSSDTVTYTGEKIGPRSQVKKERARMKKKIRKERQKNGR
jgi:hypothetical protein